MRGSDLTNRNKSVPRFLLNLLLRGRGWKKSSNYFKYDWNVLKDNKADFVPPVFVATITEACNLRCPTCLYRLQDENYLNNSRYMSLFDFNSALNKFNAERADTIFLTGGEPLMHPDFGLFVDLSKKNRLKVKVSTNGILLITTNVLTLRKLDDINVSLDAWNEGSFNKYRGGSPTQWSKIKDGLSYLNNNGIKFSISFLLTTESVKYIEAMLRFADLVQPDTVHLHNVNPHGSNIKPLVVQHEGDIDYLYVIKGGIRINYDYDIVVSHVFDTSSKDFYTKRCVLPWYYFCFNSRGDISPCCHIEHNRQLYGNVDDSDSDKLNHFRVAMIDGGQIESTSCKFCHRRFLGDNYAVYSRRKGRWIK